MHLRLSVISLETVGKLCPRASDSRRMSRLSRVA